MSILEQIQEIIIASSLKFHLTLDKQNLFNLIIFVFIFAILKDLFFI